MRTTGTVEHITALDALCDNALYLFTGLKFLNGLSIKSFLSLTKFSVPLSHHISMTVYLLSLLMVTTHALHLMSLLSNHHHRSVTHRSFRHASPHLWNQLPTSLRIPHPNYSSPSQWPSFEHAGLTCYTLLLPSITFHCFTLSSKPIPFQKILSSTLVCFCRLLFMFDWLIDWLIDKLTLTLTLTW